MYNLKSSYGCHFPEEKIKIPVGFSIVPVWVLEDEGDSCPCWEEAIEQ